MWTLLVVNGGGVKEGSVLTVESKVLTSACEALLKRLGNRKIKVQVSL